MARSRVLGIAFTVWAVLVTAGCAAASSNPSAGNLISRMETAVNAAQSVHLSGSIVVQGHFARIDLNMTRSGGLWGTVSAGPVAYHLLVTGGKTYIAPNR